jgi:hypothetical protein
MKLFKTLCAVIHAVKLTQEITVLQKRRTVSERVSQGAASGPCAEPHTLVTLLLKAKGKLFPLQARLWPRGLVEV